MQETRIIPTTSLRCFDRNPDVSTSKGTLAATADLVKMGLLDELSAKQMHLWTVSPKMRHPRVMSKLLHLQICREESVKTVCGRQGLNS